MRHLALAVGPAGRNAVGIQPHATHAEAGARAEAARADLQVLRVVGAVVHHQPGHPGQHLAEVDLRAALAKQFAVDHADGVGRLGGGALSHRAGDNHLLGRCRGHRRQRGGLDKEQADDMALQKWIPYNSTHYHDLLFRPVTAMTIDIVLAA